MTGSTEGPYYYLMDPVTHKTYPAANLMEWAKAFEHLDRQVALDRWGHATVSTCFLGLALGGGSKPLLFETMVFGVPSLEDASWRYATYKEALKGHRKTLDLVLALKE